MANSLNTNPLILNTVTAATLKNSGATLTAPFRIVGIHWDSTGAVAGDTVVLQDGLGNQIYSNTVGTIAAHSSPVVFPQPYVVNDLKLTAISEGTLYIYLASS